MTDLSQQKSRLQTHEEVDENAEDVVYESKGASAPAPAGNGALTHEGIKLDDTSPNLYTFSPSELKADMEKVKGLLHHKPYVPAGPPLSYSPSVIYILSFFLSGRHRYF